MLFFYAERIDNNEIVEKGVFTSIAEFAPYRQYGWSATDPINAQTDAFLSCQKIRHRG